MQRMRTIKQTMEYIRAEDPYTALTEFALKRLISNGAIPSTKVGRKRLLSLDVLDEYLKTAPTAPPIQEAPTGVIRKINVAL